jgi:hypothetical protein
MGEVIMQARVYLTVDAALPSAVAHARLSRKEDSQHFIEKCETCAVGRALTFLDYKAKKPAALAEVKNIDRGARPRRQAERPQSGQQEDGTFAVKRTAEAAAGRIGEKEFGQLCAMWETATKEYDATDRELREQMRATFGVNHRKELPAARSAEALRWMSATLGSLRKAAARSA